MEVIDMAAFAKLREAEELLSVQIDDFKGEEIDPDNEPDLYLPLSAARALHKALADQAATLAARDAEVKALREALHLAASRLQVASVDAIRVGETRLSADCITWANDATRAALGGSHERG